MSRMREDNCTVCTKPMDTQRVSYGGESFGIILSRLGRLYHTTCFCLHISRVFPCLFYVLLKIRKNTRENM